MSIGRWSALRIANGAILNFNGGRVQARKLASLVGTVISMKFTWDPFIQLYTRNRYAFRNDAVIPLNCSVTISNEAYHELHFWQSPPCLRFESDSRPCNTDISKMSQRMQGILIEECTTRARLIFVDNQYFSESATINPPRIVDIGGHLLPSSACQSMQGKNWCYK